MKLLVSALETSSNMHLKALLDRGLECELDGIFSSKIIGKTPRIDSESFGIMGFVDVIKKIGFFFEAKKRIVEAAKEADMVLLIDGSGFNLPLAKALKKRYPSLCIYYYILPQVWASRPHRAKKVARYIDRALGIIPFESSYYPQDFNIEYVGHPLLDSITHTHQPQSGNFLFMPGSRSAEIKALMPHFRSLIKQLPHTNATLAIPPHFSPAQIKQLYGDISEFEISFDSQEALSKASFAFICSGTATLEAALIGTPFTLCYIAKPFDYFIAKMLLNIEQIGLANILLKAHNGKLLHEELIQQEVTVQNLLASFKRFDYEQFRTNAKELKSLLGHGSAQNLLDAIKEC